MKDPKLYLCIDNCFACKRWVKPLDWMLLIKDMGLTYVEQSADTECDPLYMGAEHTAEWLKMVKLCSEKTGVRVMNVYSGHGTYATCGLSHWDEKVRARFREQWMKPQADTAAALNAGFGFFAHGFEDSALQSRLVYTQKLQTLYDDLAILAAYAREIGLPYIGLEQMYTPHMPPWTINGAREMLKSVLSIGGAPMYITLDVGHMNGQQYFQKPTEDYVSQVIEAARAGKPMKRVWLGTAAAYAIYREAASGKISLAAAATRILEDAQQNPHLFAQPEDGSIWKWIEALGKYSPIVHLQQSDGKASPHWPFSDDYNRIGVVTGEKLIDSLSSAFACADEDGMPKPADEIALTLEPFMGTTANVYDAVDDITASVAYWRKFLPRDGMRLSEARELL